MLNLIDLHYECSELKSDTTVLRSQELAGRLPGVALCALGGFPFIKTGDSFTFCGNLVENPGDLIIDGLGLSAVLTYTNKAHKSLTELGEICRTRKHLWAFHWINATLVFARFPPEVEMAFARDKRFYLSWIVGAEPTGQVFAATAGLKEWQKYVSHKDDTSFDKATRTAMAGADSLLKELI